MKLTLILTLFTEMRQGGNRGVMQMFSKTVTLNHLTGKQLVNWIDHQYLEVDSWNFRIRDISIVDNEQCVCEGFAYSHILKKFDSLECYQQLVKEGWVPNTKDARAIESDGYVNFRAEKF